MSNTMIHTNLLLRHLFMPGGKDCKLSVRWIQSDNITYNNVAEELEGISGILVGHF